MTKKQHLKARCILTSCEPAALDDQHAQLLDQLAELKALWTSNRYTLAKGHAYVIDLELRKKTYKLLRTQLQNPAAQVSALLFKSPLNIKLAIFDMDSTLIEAEVIDELAQHQGVCEQVKAITSQAMQGQLDFNQSFIQRLALLKGLPANELPTIADKLPLMPGAHALFYALQQQGIRTAIISGGFQFFADHIKLQLGADLAYANTLEITDEQLTGKHLGTIVGPHRKRELLQDLQQEFALANKNILAVGDGANDWLMLQSAGYGVAFHAKPFLKERAKFILDSVSLDVLQFLTAPNAGMSDHI